jgi:hypothetical protein
MILAGTIVGDCDQPLTNSYSLSNLKHEGLQPLRATQACYDSAPYTAQRFRLFENDAAALLAAGLSTIA